MRRCSIKICFMFVMSYYSKYSFFFSRKKLFKQIFLNISEINKIYERDWRNCVQCRKNFTSFFSFHFFPLTNCVIVFSEMEQHMLLCRLLFPTFMFTFLSFVMICYKPLPVPKKTTYKETTWRFQPPIYVQCGKHKSFVKLVSTKRLKALK